MNRAFSAVHLFFGPSLGRPPQADVEVAPLALSHHEAPAISWVMRASVCSGGVPAAEDRDDGDIVAAMAQA